MVECTTNPTAGTAELNLFSIMAKGNMLLGHARGKVGSLVFSRANGQQIVRSRAEVVKNPQTQNQMVQRILMNTIAQAYSNMSAITDHSFEGVTKGAKCMNAFMSKNLDNIRSYVAQQVKAGATFSEIVSFSPLKSNIFAGNTYVVSKGTLPVIDVIDNSADATMAMPLTENTYEGIINEYGLQRGDQLTFLAITGSTPYNLTFKFVRVILDPIDNEGNELDLSTMFVQNGAIVSPNPRNEGSFNSLTFADSKLAIGFGSTYMMSAGIIVSRKSNGGTWLRSNCTLIANESQTNAGYSLQDCLDKLTSGDVDTISEDYLNNSGTGTVANKEVTSSDSGGVFIPEGGGDAG